MGVAGKILFCTHKKVTIYIGTNKERMKKILTEEVKRMQKLAGIQKEDSGQGTMTVKDAFMQAGIDLNAPCVTVDDELTVREFTKASGILARLERRAAGQQAEGPVFMFPKDIAHPDELMGTPDQDMQATQGLNFKLIVDILDGGFVEIWQ